MGSPPCTDSSYCWCHCRFWITKNKNEKKIKEYKNQIAQGNKYVEDLDYEKAEESYLKAIKIDPKRKNHI